MIESSQEYYQRWLPQNAGFHIEEDMKGKGKGWRATKDWDALEVVLEEEPWVVAQFEYNKVYFPACEYCLRCLEDPEKMIERLSGQQQQQQHLDQLWKMDGKETWLLFRDKVDPKGFAMKESFCCCEQCQQDYYCSPQCKEKAWNEYHSLLCFGVRKKESEPLIHLEEIWKSMHVPPESATIRLFIKLVAMILVQLNKGRPWEECMLPLSLFKRNSDLGEQGIFHRFLDKEFEQGLTKLHGLFREALYDSRLDVLFTEEGFKTLFALVCLNGQGVGTSSLEYYEDQLHDFEEDPQFNLAMEQLQAFDEVIEEHSGDFTRCEGTGLYRLHSCLNHSCIPNAICRFPYNRATVQVMTLRPIMAGEEITICYLDCHAIEEDEPIEVFERKKFLQKYYLFECRCEKCVSDLTQLSAPEKT